MIAVPLTYHTNSLYLLECIAHLDWPVMLDSSKGFTGHHVDILAANPTKRIHFDGCSFTVSSDHQTQHFETNDFELIRSIIHSSIESNQAEHQPCYGPGWLGAVAYDFLQLVNQSAQSGMSHSNKDALMLGFYPWIIVVDHKAEKTALVALPGCEGELNEIKSLLSAEHNHSPFGSTKHSNQAFHLTSTFKPDTTPNEYNAAFQQVQSYILAGDCYQINLTQRFSATYEGPPLKAYFALRGQHSTPMACFFNYGSGILCSLSPERFLRIQERVISTQPIKGTIKRGNNEQSDALLKRQLFRSEKDRAENVMIVDLLRNDLGKISKTGSVTTSKLFDIESFPNVHHMVSTISAELLDDVNCFDAFLACFPGGSITGAPKIRAMQIISELESQPRDLYCGAFIYMPVTGYFDSSILIRSLVFKEGQVRCWGGGGVVADSVQNLEYEESITKISQLMAILEKTIKSE